MTARPQKRTSPQLNFKDNKEEPKDSATEQKKDDISSETSTNVTEVKNDDDFVLETDKTDGAVEVTQQEPGEDNQVNNQENDGFDNPDGVTNSGGKNVINKTPADMSAETPEESRQRYGFSDEVPQAVHDNPNVTFTNDNRNFQIPGGTHLHPDVARDNYNRSVGERAESGQVTISGTQNVYAVEAELDDKGIKNDQRDDLA